MELGEDGILEILEFVLCLIAFVILLLSARNEFTKRQFDRLAVSLFISIVPFVGGGRELSFGEVVGVTGVKLLETKYVLAGILVLLLVLSAAALLVAYRNGTFRLMRSILGYHFFILAFFAIVFGQLFEKGQLGLPRSELVEELFELLGYFFLVCLAVSRFRASRK